MVLVRSAFIIARGARCFQLFSAAEISVHATQKWVEIADLDQKSRKDLGNGSYELPGSSDTRRPLFSV
eukprot:111229-Rhodomonas_salina.1